MSERQFKRPDAFKDRMNVTTVLTY